MLRETPWTLARGFLMGAADVVPGVSGGTIALVVGIYERLISSVRAGSTVLGRLVSRDLGGARQWLGRVEWSFIVPLVLGIGLAIVTLAGVLERLLHDRPVEMAALFLGLVAGSIVIASRMIRHRQARHWATMTVVALVVFVILGLRGGTSADSVGQVSDPALLAFLGAGALAICAMILPGISGSFILVLLGMYGPVLGAVNDRDLAPLVTFAVGATAGLALFSQFLHWALATHHDRVIAILVGLMAGSLRILWPWPDGLESSALGAPGGALGASAVLMIGGVGLVIAITSLARRLDSGSQSG